jgi:hypothetical protein
MGTKVEHRRGSSQEVRLAIPLLGTKAEDNAEQFAKRAALRPLDAPQGSSALEPQNRKEKDAERKRQKRASQREERIANGAGLEGIDTAEIMLLLRVPATYLAADQDGRFRGSIYAFTDHRWG